MKRISIYPALFAFKLSPTDQDLVGKTMSGIPR